MADSLVPLLWAGLVFTIPLTLLSFTFGLVLGLITAIARLFGAAPFVAIARFYVWVIRGTPLLVQLFVIFYGLPSIGILLDAFPAALIGFTLNIGAYSSEIIRAVISSVPKGQWEAPGPRHSRAASSSAWQSPGRWPPLPASSSATNRHPRSTRNSPPKSSTSLAASPARARPWSWPPTT
jgi:His/Glu/Gln/Arg/opine family amino acid ABC transporter permease subunit